MTRDNDCIQESICTSWFASCKGFENHFKNQIHNCDFSTSDLVLVWNLQIKKELNWKMKPCYLGPMVVLCRTTGGLYLLAELDGAILRLWYMAFRLLPYFPHSKLSISVMQLTRLDNQQIDAFDAENNVEHEENEKAVLKD